VRKHNLQKDLVDLMVPLALVESVRNEEYRSRTIWKKALPKVSKNKIKVLLFKWIISNPIQSTELINQFKQVSNQKIS